MVDNPLINNPAYINDPEGLIVPYKLIGKTDLELLTDKYNRLRKQSHGLIVRLGIPAKNQ